MRQIKAASTVASPRVGLIRVALTGVVALMLAWAFPGLKVLTWRQGSRCSSVYS
jgi:hypothetical protein